MDGQENWESKTIQYSFWLGIQFWEIHLKGREVKFPMLVCPGIKDFGVRPQSRRIEKENRKEMIALNYIKNISASKGKRVAGSKSLTSELAQRDRLRKSKTHCSKS